MQPAVFGSAMGLHPDAELAGAAIKMVVAAHRGRDAIWRDEVEQGVFPLRPWQNLYRRGVHKLC